MQMPTIRQKPVLAVPPPAAAIEQDPDGASDGGALATPANAAGTPAAGADKGTPRTSSSTPGAAGTAVAKKGKGEDDGADERVANSEQLVTILEGFEEALSSVGSGELFTILYSLSDAVFYKPQACLEFTTIVAVICSRLEPYLGEGANATSAAAKAKANRLSR